MSGSPPRWPSGHRPRVLLTGASGVVGSAVARALSDTDLTVLAHRALPGRGRVVHGDLTQERCGLTPSEHRALWRQTDLVVHSAGVVRFGASPKDLHTMNVHGTERISQLCAAADIPLIYVSTAFVRPRGSERNRVVPPYPHARPDDYIVSKRAGEAAVHAAGTRGAIVRPSVVIGDSDTGEMPAFQGMHGFIQSVLRCTVPFMGCAPQVLIDVIPRDVVGAAVRAVAHRELQGGRGIRTHWLTSGSAGISAARLVEVIAERGERSGMRVARMPFAPVERIDRLLRPVLAELLPPAPLRRLEELIALLSLFDETQPFTTDLGRIPGGPVPLSSAQVEDAVARNVDRLVTVRGWGRPSHAAPA